MLKTKMTVTLSSGAVKDVQKVWRNRFKDLSSNSMMSNFTMDDICSILRIPGALPHDAKIESPFFLDQMIRLIESTNDPRREEKLQKRMASLAEAER